MKALYKNLLSTKLIFILTTALAVPIINSQQNDSFSVAISSHDITVLVDGEEHIVLQLKGIPDQTYNITLKKQHPDLIELNPPSLVLGPDKDRNNTYDIVIHGLLPGRLGITSKTIPKQQSIENEIFLRVTVANSWPIYYLSIVFGWIYFLAWSISFYPQIYINFKRKSVVGLNFDFLSLNIVGFALYSGFNIGLFWIPEIEDEYSRRNPIGLNPVLINDVFFSIHAMLATSITIFQCFIYERAEQRVSITARGILLTFVILIVIFAGLAGGKVIHWLDFLYYCSYIKLAITLIKYIPQAVMNYRRKSTLGWSIGNILLDFTGGVLSMMQMILNAYNYDDWDSIFGDPTKFGLGLFSVCFDIFFMLQHYVFYRGRQPYEEIPGNCDPNLSSDNEIVEEGSRNIEQC